MRRVRYKFLMLLVLLCLFCSCHTQNDFYAGEPVTPDELAAIKNALQQQESTEKQEEAGDTQDKQTPWDGTVYWLSGGSVYHKDATCYHINGKTNINSGSVDEASAAGKSRGCSNCATE